MKDKKESLGNAVFDWRGVVSRPESVAPEDSEIMDNIAKLFSPEEIEEEKRNVQMVQEKGNATYGTDVKLSEAHLTASALVSLAFKRKVITPEEYRRLGDRILSRID